MAVKLMNSAMMPHGGLYHCRQISKREFCARLVEAHEAGTLESYIGYQSNLDYIERWTGLRLSQSLAQTNFQPSDVALVMKLNCRTRNKGKFIPKESDYTFWLVEYLARETATMAEKMQAICRLCQNNIKGGV